MSMFRLSKCIITGNLTRDPNSRSFPDGGCVTDCGLAFDGQLVKKDGKWTEETAFIDFKAFDPRGNGFKLATYVNKHARKGAQVTIEGRIVQEHWTDKTTGGARSKHLILLEKIIYHQRIDTNGTNGDQSTQSDQSASSQQSNYNEYDDYNSDSGAVSSGTPDDIPF